MGSEVAWRWPYSSPQLFSPWHRYSGRSLAERTGSALWAAAPSRCSPARSGHHGRGLACVVRAPAPHPAVARRSLHVFVGPRHVVANGALALQAVRSVRPFPSGWSRASEPWLLADALVEVLGGALCAVCRVNTWFGPMSVCACVREDGGRPAGVASMRLPWGCGPWPVFFTLWTYQC